MSRVVIALVLCLSVAATAQAGALSAMKFADGWYLFGDTGTALVHAKLQHGSINNIQVGQGVAIVKADGECFLYGLTPNGIASRKLSDELISAIHLGEEIAVVQIGGKTVLFGVTSNGIAELVAGDRYPSSVQVCGKLVLVNFRGEYVFYASTPQGLVRCPVNGKPNAIQLGRDMAVVRYSGSGTWVLSLGAATFHWVQASKGQPSNLMIPQGQDVSIQQLNFDALHSRPEPR